MNTIVYHGAPAWRMASFIENGCITPAPEGAHRADPGTDPTELHCILSQCAKEKVNDEIRLAYLWALIGELSVGGHADTAYVMRIRVPDSLVQVEDDTCMVQIPDDDEGIPMSWVSEVYEFPVTPKDLLSAAGFVRWQRKDRTKGIIDQMPEDYMDFGMLDDRCIELLRDDLNYKEIPAPIPGDKFLSTRICCHGENCYDGDYPTVTTFRRAYSMMAEAVQAVLKDAVNHEFIAVDNVAILPAKVRCGPYVRIIDVGPYLQHMDPYCLYTILQNQHPECVGDILAREIAHVNPEVAALDILSHLMSSSLKPYVDPKSEESFNLEVSINHVAAEHWLKKNAPGQWDAVQAWRKKSLSSSV